MTVTYTFNVATSTFCTFHRLLFRWKGSVWQAVWAELLIWCLLYTFLSILYHLFLIKHHKEIFEDICIFFDQHSTFIPVTFMLGFYVSAVFNRWWQVFNNIGWIDQPALQITQAIRGDDERSKMLRRTCIRYLVIMEALVFRDISTSVRIRFPTPRHLVTSGLMTEREFEEYDAVVSPHAKYWLPIQWMMSILTLARDESRIKGEHIYVNLIEKVAEYRTRLVRLVLFDWVPVPLVYTQVVHLAVYSYFGVALFGRQYLDRDAVKKSINIYVPIMTILQFIFIVGWLKRTSPQFKESILWPVRKKSWKSYPLFVVTVSTIVAEVLLNPLGEDDDDFECNWIIDRNLQVGFSVEECYDKYPPIDRDSFWTESNPEPLYTASSAMRPTNPQIGSCVNMNTTADSEFMVRPKRSIFTTRRSVWDGQISSSDIVPVIRCRSREEDEPLSSMRNSGSTSSMKGFLKQLRKHSRRMSNVFRRQTPAYEVRTPESPSVSSDVSLDGVGLTTFSTNTRGRSTSPNFAPPPVRKVNVIPSTPTEQQKTMTVPNLSQKRHSAPDALKMIARPVDGSSALPMIMEEKDKPRRQSDEENSEQKKRRSSTGSMPDV